ncbi:MAG: hypothetical protein Q8K30_01070 [Candidatus Gracilibacteria bacterium]|nr:hypothetical protein [Candidatus Gracilibacteria bacterium]
MKNKLSRNTETNTIKNSLSNKTRGIIFAVSTLSGLIVGGNIKSSIEQDYSFENPIDKQRYEQIKNEFSFSDRGFIRTIEDKDPKQILNKDLKKHEKKILRLSRGNIKNGNLYFTFVLSKENINDIKSIIISLNYLMDAMYGEGYSNILIDGNDHSDKILVIDIKETENGNIIRKLSIEDKTNKELSNNINEKNKQLT